MYVVFDVESHPFPPFFLKLDVCWSMLEGQKGKQMGSEDSQQSQEWRPLKMSSDTTKFRKGLRKDRLKELLYNSNMK